MVVEKMSKTIRIQDKTYRKLGRMGFVDQSYNDIIDDLIDFAKLYDSKFEDFLTERYEEEEEE